jgi:hypothetical protein
MACWRGVNGYNGLVAAGKFLPHFAHARSLGAIPVHKGAMGGRPGKLLAN